jgi:pimeloyl-ACP methyl ester carboxylesterase
LLAAILLTGPGCRVFHSHHSVGSTIDVDCDARTRLNFVDPCQPGKIPVVLIHGVFDNSKRWDDLIHDLRACPTVCDHFQFWTIDYDADQEFFCLVAAVRRRLVAAYQTCDTTGEDPALKQTVLIGHSLGGLVAKVLVADGESCTHARRVIFIATPHCGSRHANFSGVTSMFLQTRGDSESPSNVDLLKPDSPALAAIRQLPVRSDVKLHSIVGVAHPISLDGPSDGLVAVSNAYHPGVQSQLAVPAIHSQVPRSPRTIAEVQRILEEHVEYIPTP